MIRTRSLLVPIVLCTTGVVLCALTGCERTSKSSSETKVAPPSEYMKDPAFRAKMDAQQKERDGYIAQRSKLVAEMQKMVTAAKEKMPQATDDQVKAELAKSAEWNSLVKRVEDLNAVLKENRARSAEIFRERVLPKKETISK